MSLLNLSMADDKKTLPPTVATEQETTSLSDVDIGKDVFDTSDFDPVLAKKMALINDAIDQVGMTPWQWKLFFLNGFGYAVDSVRGVSD